MTLAKQLQWATDSLQRNANSTPCQVDTFLTTPWSQVSRLHTPDELYYLKSYPSLFAIEPHVLTCLASVYGASVPDVIDYSSPLNCFLMRSAGVNLREQLLQSPNTQTILRLFHEFIQLQKKVSADPTPLLNTGAPILSLTSFSQRLDSLLTDQKTLLGRTQQARKLVSALHGKLDTIHGTCLELQAYGIPDSVVSPDFSDNNAVISNTGQIALIDLGEIVISHPLFSLTNALYKLKQWHRIEGNSPIVAQIKTQVQDELMPSDMTADDHQRVWHLANRLWPVFALANQVRFITACGKENLIAANHMKLPELLEICNTHF